jgi:exodeoxyribonuclease VII large subunit
LTVTALVNSVREALLDGLPPKLRVVGQISNFKRHSSGHLYFSLKDDNACIAAVMFAREAGGVRFDVADGLEVLAEGRVDVFDKQGKLQLYVTSLSPKGTGALELAFRQLKEKLEREGLFNPAHKVPIPRYPRAIGVITSPTGAAVRDIARTLRRRWPAGKVYLLGVPVQGEGAGEQLAEAIGLLDRAAVGLGIGTIIIARGGGSLEDLWAFNEECVARAICAAVTPIISGVGHEVDFTIADFVADLRAATPTAAAELATPDGAQLLGHVTVLSSRLRRRAGETLTAARAALAAMQRSVVLRDPQYLVRGGRQQADELLGRLKAGLRDRCRHAEHRLGHIERQLAEDHPRRRHERALTDLERLRHRLAWVLGHRAKRAADQLNEMTTALAGADPHHAAQMARQRVDALARQLESMSHRAVIARGFSLTRGRDGTILRSVRQAHAGDVLATELADGTIASRVQGEGQAPQIPAPAPPAPRKNRRKDTDDGPSLF